LRELPAAVDQLAAPAVGEREDQAEPRVPLQAVDRLLELLSHLTGEVGGPADRLQSDVVVRERLRLLDQDLPEEAHQRAHLGVRAAPVLARKREEGEAFDAELSASLHDLADGAASGLVPGDPRQAS